MKNYASRTSGADEYKKLLPDDTFDILNLASLPSSTEGGSSPPPVKRARLSASALLGVPSLIANTPGMQSDGVLSNGQALLNGTANGCDHHRSPGLHRPSNHNHIVKHCNRLTPVDADTIRLIGQHLRELGFHDTLERLSEEAGFDLENPKAAKFRACVMAGNWHEAEISLQDMIPLLADPMSIERMRLLLLKEKYMELLEEGSTLDALKCLRCEIAPLHLHHSDKEVHVLASYMMYSTKEELHRAADWPGAQRGARDRLMDQLQAFLPASVMLPPMRLRHLLTQACQLQVERCPFHYLEQDASNYSLLTDHICSRKQFPSEPLHVLTDHGDEVWYLKFSHNGTRLASGARDGQIIIWSLADSQPKKVRQIKGQSDGIACLAWSPDDSLLLSCGREDCSEALVFNSETGEMKCRVHNSPEESLTCCAWHNDGKRFYLGGTRGQFLECSLDGSVMASWEGIRLQAIATHPSSDVVYAADTHNRIRQYNFRDKSSTTLVQEDCPIMSFTLSRNGQHALLNVTGQGVHVWDLRDRCLVRRYQGIQQGLYTIHSTYGGMSDSFIASGSEDNQVYVWHCRREMPVVVLQGHTRPVNCVAWNPVTLDMIASASDDGSVRLWGTEEELKRLQEYSKQHLSADDEDKLKEACADTQVAALIYVDQASELEAVDQSNSSLSSSGQLDDGIGLHQMEESQMAVASGPTIAAESGTSSSGSLGPADTGHQREQDRTTPQTGSSVTTTV